MHRRTQAPLIIPGPLSGLDPGQRAGFARLVQPRERSIACRVMVCSLSALLYACGGGSGEGTDETGLFDNQSNASTAPPFVAEQPQQNAGSEIAEPSSGDVLPLYPVLEGEDLAPQVITDDASGLSDTDFAGLPDPEEEVNVSDPAVCNVATQNQWVYDKMRDDYLFYDQVPVVNPQAYLSPQALLDEIRFNERDPFSHLTDAAASALQFDEGREFGLGFSMRYDVNNVARLATVHTAGPFGLLGLERGDQPVSVNGVAWNDQMLADSFLIELIGTPDAPGSASWEFRKRDTGQLISLDITAAEYDINTVVRSQIFRNVSYEDQFLDGPVAYLAFTRFLDTSVAELLSEFERYRTAGVTELVLDLRYNRGGRINVAALLASLIGGESRAGKRLLEYRFNDKYTQNNFSLLFQSGVGELNLTRVIVLTGNDTASASEIVIGGLQPYMEVVTIGAATAGKPYVQIPEDRCGARLNAIQAEGFNAANESVSGGVPASCYALDDVTRDFGVGADGRSEGMLDAALQYLVGGVCQTLPLLAQSPDARRPSVIFNGSFDPGGSIR